MHVTYPPAKDYVHRHDFIAGLCAGKSVLDIGFVGEVSTALDHKVAQFEHSLHLRLNEVAKSVVGIDIDSVAVKSLQARCSDLTCVAGNVENVEQIPGAPFEIIVAGDVLEHMDGPGMALANLRRFLEPNGRLIISVPNAFGLPNYLRFLAGRFTDGPDHVQTYTRFTIANALRRHGYAVEEVYTGLDRTPRSKARRAVYTVLKQGLKLFPELGGTLIVVARLA